MTDEEAVVHILAGEVQCYECGKWISDEEWVVCWGSCNDCLNVSFENYQEHIQKQYGRPAEE